MSFFDGKGFELVLASPPEYERLTAEIFFDGRFVALISQERNKGIFDLEIPGSGLDEDNITRKVDLNGFIEAVGLACKRLKGEVK